MTRFTAKGYCGEEHNIDELHACPKCRFYMKGWNEAIERAAIICADKISRDAVRMLKK